MNPMQPACCSIPTSVPVYSVGVERGIHYYAMQLIDGTSMDSWIKDPSHGLEDWRTVVGWASQIADALQSAHETGVIHRDVKPSNLMLDQSGKVWITDFGLARCQSDLSLTLSGDLVGTMRYMSPEQARGESALVDGRTDTYSLAATLYEMLTLQPAHLGDDAPTILKYIDEQHVAPIRNVRDDIPRDLETVIFKAMSKRRDDRYDTVQAFADDLRRVLSGELTIARPPTVPDRIVRWAAKHRRSVLVTLLVGAMGLVGFAVSLAMITAEKRVSDAIALRNERNEQLAHGAVDRLGSQMAELLSEIPAAESVRRRLLAETLNYYQQFAESAHNDPELREDLAMTFGKIGSLHSKLARAKKPLTRSEIGTPVFRIDRQLAGQRNCPVGLVDQPEQFSSGFASKRPTKGIG